MKKSILIKLIKEELGKLNEDWWNDLTSDAQDEYLRDHPNSEKAKEIKAATKEKTKKTPEEDYYLRVKNNDRKLSREGFSKLQDKVKKSLEDADKDLIISQDSKDQDTLDKYVSIEYQNINSQLRSGKVSSDVGKIVANLDKVIQKNKLPRDLIVYRSVEPSAIKEKDPAFKSTTLSPMIANNFKRRGAEIFRFKIPKGTPYAYIGGGEKEVLFPRNFQISKYQV